MCNKRAACGDHQVLGIAGIVCLSDTSFVTLLERRLWVAFCLFIHRFSAIFNNVFCYKFYTCTGITSRTSMGWKAAWQKQPRVPRGCQHHHDWGTCLYMKDSNPNMGRGRQQWSFCATQCLWERLKSGTVQLREDSEGWRSKISFGGNCWGRRRKTLLQFPVALCWSDFTDS